MTTSTIDLGSRLRLLRIPPNAIDSHMHIFDAERFPLPPSAKPPPYIPRRTPMADAIALLGGTTPRMVVVQPSTYGVDNRCQLEGVRELGGAQGGREGKSCAVVEVDPGTVTAVEMQALHDQGARGLRVNFTSRGLEPSPTELQTTLKRYADLARPLGWVVQLYTPMRSVEALAELLEGNVLGVPIVLDHFAQPDLSASPDSPEGLSTLLRILANPSSKLYIKISAPYRLLPRPSTPQSIASSPLRDLFAQLIRTAPTRLVWGSDWPHTRFDKPGEVDTLAWADIVVRWCEELAGSEAQAQEWVDGLFKGNAEELWFGREE